MSYLSLCGLKVRLGQLNKTMHILITGASGLVGSRLTECLAARGHVLRLASRTPNSFLRTGHEAVQINWEEEETLYAACKGVDAVIHASGMNAVDCSSDPVGALVVNGVGSAKLARAASRAGVERLIYFSTAHVYSNPLTGSISEDSCPSNLHPYASSKMAAEYVLRKASQEWGMQVLVLRMSNAFGAPLQPETNCWTLLVNDLCRQYARGGCLKLASNGQQWRDFIPLTDVCETVVRLLEGGHDFNSESVLNLGGCAMRVFDMAELVRARVNALFGRSVLVERSAVLDSAGVSAELDYRCDRMTNLIGTVPRDLSGEIDGLLTFCMSHFHTNDTSV